MKMLKRENKTFLDLAKMKIKAKALKAEIEELQDKLLLSTDDTKIVTDLGTFKVNKRENWNVLNMGYIFDCMQQDSFLENCSISRTGIVKGIGNQGLTHLIEQKAFVLDKVTNYFRFTAKKVKK